MLMVARLSFVVVICGRGIGVTRQRSIAWREGARGPEGGLAIRHLRRASERRQWICREDGCTHRLSRIVLHERADRGDHDLMPSLVGKGTSGVPRGALWASREPGRVVSGRDSATRKQKVDARDVSEVSLRLPRDSG